MTDRLGELLTIAQVARRAGWCCEDRRLPPGASPPRDLGCDCTDCVEGTRRMRRHLITQDKQLGGMLLDKRGTGKRTRYLVTLGALEQIHPEWFAEADSLGARLDALETQASDTFTMVRKAHEEIGILRRALAALAKVVRDMATKGAH